jgi:hypothetical protein
MKYRMLVPACLIVLLTLAAAQSLFKVPNLIDHQTATLLNGGTIKFTETVATTGNWLQVFVTCDYTDYPCAFPPTDGNGNTFSQIYDSSSGGYQEQVFYLVAPNASGTTETISVPTVKIGNYHFGAMLEQVQGLQ